MNTIRYDELQGLHPAEVAAWAAVEGFKQTWLRWFPTSDPDAVPRELMEMLKDRSMTGQEMLESLRGEPQEFTAMRVLEIGIAFCAKALQTCHADRHGDAWPLVVEAAHINGKLSGFNPSTRAASADTTSDRLTARAIGALGGKAAHVESDAFKRQVRAWCEERDPAEFGGSLNKLRDAIVAAKLNPTPESTVRRWLTEWAKDWRTEGRWPA